MPPDRPIPGSPADWLRHAKSDLALAGVELPEESFYCDLCFHSQQAVEKSIKAVLVFYGIEFKKVHHIGYLITMIPSQLKLPVASEDLSAMTNYAVMFRYPGEYEDVEIEEYQETLNQAKMIVSWAENVIANSDKIK